ncbi:hypothetical protein PHYPSEUDO_006310 [Phytophthora pseudosyringae]|uniref:Ig-like domain-containing protein n=1 Tax=Phytophthora pseudosyringae TaxID=221518 RepID=A0A8T1VIU5_9STRA|nr:hypothetical protein PHYPSEUDO_006310 [Phytophthora pseudosyringae]
MEILEEQSTKQEDDTPEPTVISRRQAELEAATERLQCTAQNFSLEWKSFLGYAMKIKQQRAPGSPPTGEKDLEDLLLKTQGGLVLLRELHNRRDRQWKEVADRSIAHISETGDVPQDKQPQWLQPLVSKLTLLNQQVAATAHCAVKGSCQGHTPLPTALLKQRAHALEAHHRLKHGADSGSDFVDIQDVNLLLQFEHVRHQQAVVLERFCIRLKWLPVSHRLHLRQRMLALIHHQKVKNTPRPDASMAYRDSKDHLHCPLFMISTSRFAAELKALAQKHSLPLSDSADVRDSKSSADAYPALRQGADALLASVVTSFPPDNAINTDGGLEMGLETVVHAYTRNSRWELIQRGYLGNCELGQRPIEDTLVALRNDHKIDSLLASEWELLSLDDAGYLRVRLEALSSAHMNRAKVDVAQSEAAAVGGTFLFENQRRTTEDAAVDDNSDNDDTLPSANRKSGLPNSWNPDALYSLYVLRVTTCRTKRLSLLRLLNYLHFIQRCQVGSLHGSSLKCGSSTTSSRQKPSVTTSTSRNSAEGAAINPWSVTKCEKTGDYLVLRPASAGKDANDDDDTNNGDREFIFAAARRDLEVLELQMLRLASIFIFKQEYDSLPASPRKRSNDRYRIDGESDSVVSTIDRLQVLRDIYECEVAFQQAKAQLVEKLLENGLQFAPTSQDLSELGFTMMETQTEPFADILLPLLQRRPYLDFSHAYFFESYAAETLLLELQTSLVQQMEQHFNRLEWCSLQEFAVDDQGDAENEQRRWVCQQILGSRALLQLYAQQNALVRQADEKWFTATSVGEFHALQHALAEQMLVIWSLIIKLELPGRPVRCLERTAGDLLLGSGWQLVFPPLLLSDACRTLHEQTNGSRTLVECLAKAVELEEWRQELAKNVYEAHLLERIHHFQFSFVKQVAALDTAIGGEQARHRAFFFECSECDRARALQPIAIELETPTPHATSAASASKHTALRSGDNKSVSEWLQAQLSTLQCFTDDCNGSDDVATQANHSENWRRSLLRLQVQYVSRLQVSVNFQNVVGADVFEFAASYPYVCLSSSDSSDSSDEETSVAMDLSTVRIKYAKEIADKMTEEMRTSCFPYWKRLETLKQQLHKRFAAAPNQGGDGLKPAFASLQPEFHLEVDMVACGHFLDEETYHPRLLTTLNDHLQRLRNEEKLMRQLRPATRAQCAFIPHSTTFDRNPNENRNDEEQLSGLTKWLLVKLHQLKVDLQIHERPKVEQLLLTPPASRSSPPASAQRKFGTDRSPVESSSSDTHMLLQTIPSFRSLLETFAMTGNYEKPTRDSSTGAANAQATRLHEYREETLRTLVFIFDQFSCTVDSVRLRCGSRFVTTKTSLFGSGQRHLPAMKRSGGDSGSAHSGLGRLERWQALFHDEIRQLLDHLTSRLSPEAAIATGDLFDTHPEHLQRQHYASLLRQEMCTALQEANVHSIRLMRCTANFAILQTYHKNAGLRVRRRRQHLMNFQTVLGETTAEVTRSVNAQNQAHDTATTDLSGSNHGAPFTAKMRRLVWAGEQVWFGEARPREREREWQAFEDAVGKYEARDSAYIEVVTRLLELHRVYIDENCRAVLRLAEETASPSLALQCTAESQALGALDDLWERFHLPASDSLSGGEVSVRSGRSTAPVVGGENLHMKKRLLGNMGTSSASGTSTFSSPKDLSYALRSLQMGGATALAQFCNTGLLVLPPPSSIEEQLAYLQLSVELTWVDADMKELEDQYKKFLFHRKTHREHQRAPNVTPRQAPRSPQTASGPSCATSSSMLLALSKYFQEEGISVDKAQSPDASSTKQKPIPAFIVPASEMACFLHEMTKQCVEHNKQQLDLHRESIQQLHNQCHAADLDRQEVEKQWAKAKVEERIRCEAAAVDHAFHLYFEVQALRKQLSVLEARRELDHQVLRCELNAEYEEKLHAMHVEILSKQQKFAEYRTTMQRELQSVIQGAHSQFVDQLLDYSGTIPSTTKNSVSHLLRGQRDIVRVKSENAAMKQALVKVQALGDMQQQTQNAAHERELLLTQRFATAEALQRNEVEQLQVYVKQLEGNLSKLSQEKTYFQVKWTTAQKQMEAAAQRRREAKVRALSATCTRKPATPGGAGSDDDDGLPAIFLSAHFVPDRDTDGFQPRKTNVSDTESITGVSTARPQTTASTVDDVGKRERQRLEAQYLNSARHYQNEIRRLQQQVTREIREKAAIAEQLTQLRQYESAASTLVDDLQTPLGEQSLRRDFLLPSRDRRTQSASPRATLRSNSCVATPPDRLATTPRRPNSSISPRASMLRAQATVGSGSQPPTLVPYANTPAASAPASSRPSTASSTSGTPARKFQVVKRETSIVGGVAGVPNTLSVREPLPYR